MHEYKVVQVVQLAFSGHRKVAGRGDLAFEDELAALRQIASSRTPRNDALGTLVGEKRRRQPGAVRPTRRWRCD